MDVLMLLATVLSLFFAWRAAANAADAFAFSRATRQDERTTRRLLQLDRVVSLLSEVEQARTTAIGGGGAEALNAGLLARGRLLAGIAATGFGLPQSEAMAAGDHGASFMLALNEVSVRIVELEATLHEPPAAEPAPPSSDSVSAS